MGSISVFVCESQPIVVEGLRKVFGETTDLEFAGAVSRPADVLDGDLHRRRFTKLFGFADWETVSS